MRHLVLLVLCLAALPVRAEEWVPPADDPAASVFDAGNAGATPAERRAFDLKLASLEGREAAALALGFLDRHPEARLTPAQLAHVRETLAREASNSAKRDAFGDALAAAFSPDPEGARLQKLEALVALQDARAVPVLAYLARRDTVPGVRERAATLLGEFRQAEAEWFAAALAQAADLPPAVRAGAVRALESQGTPGAGETLGRIALDTDAPAVVRQAASDGLRRTYPVLAQKLGVREKVTDSSGRLLGSLVGALSGSYSLALVGSLAPSEGVGVITGVFGGLVIGGAGAYLLSSSADLSETGAAYLLSAGAWSIPTGFFLGALTGGQNASCDKPCRAIALATHVVSLVGAWQTKDAVARSWLDVGETNVGALSGLFLLRGVVGLFPRTGDDRPALGVMAGGMLAGFGLGAAYAPSLNLTTPLAALGLLFATEAAFAGYSLGYAFAPADGPFGTTLFTRRADFSDGTTYLGLGLALGGVLAASSVWQPSASTAQFVGFGSATGTLLGIALPLAFDSYPNEKGGSVGLALGAVAGGLGLGLLEDPLGLAMTKGDGLLTSFALAHGFGQALILLTFEPFQTDARNLALLPGITGLAGAAAIGIAQKTDLSTWEAAWLFSGAMWGYWLGFWGSEAAFATANEARWTTLVLSNVGLAITAASIAMGTDPTALAWVNVTGVLGMTAAVLGATFIAYDPNSTARPVSTANVVGSVIGLAAGAFLAPSLVEMGQGTKGAGGDAFDLVPPMVNTLPVFDRSGQRVEGMSAQLTWVM